MLWEARRYSLGMHYLYSYHLPALQIMSCSYGLKVATGSGPSMSYEVNCLSVSAICEFHFIAMTKLKI